MPFIRKNRFVSALLPVLLMAGAGFAAVPVWAGVRGLPADLTREVLSESVPTAFALFDLQAEDIAPAWKGAAPRGVQVSIIPGSVQWVRISQFMVIPRARLRIRYEGWDGARARVAGFEEAAAQAGPGQIQTLEVPVALMAMESASVTLTLRKGRETRAHALSMGLRPRPGSPADRLPGRVFADSSCSPYSPQFRGAETLPKEQWVHIGCRMVRTRAADGEVPTLEVYLHWEGAVGPVSSQGTPVEPLVDGLWVLRLGPDHSVISLKSAGGQELELKFFLPKRLSYASLGFGIGPYGYRFDDSRGSLDKLAPIATIYGSFFLTEGSRMVFFDAFAPGSRWFNDMGFYFNNESSRALDDRLSFNLLLGFHVIGFKSASSVAYRLGVPQGFEMIFRDVLRPRWNTGIGGFFYPPIAGKSYYNAWVRYGTSSIFAELNYIAWSEVGVESERVYSRSLGISIGGPIFLFR